jgi:hypothetical protein
VNWDLTRINQNISGKWAKKSLYVKHFSSPQCSIQPRRHISTNVWRAARTVTRGRAHKILCYWRPPWSDYWDNIQRLELLSHSPSYSPSSLMSSRLPMVDAMKATTVAVAHWHPLATTGSTRRARKVCRQAQLSGESRSVGAYRGGVLTRSASVAGTRRPAPRKTDDDQGSWSDVLKKTWSEKGKNSVQPCRRLQAAQSPTKLIDSDSIGMNSNFDITIYHVLIRIWIRILLNIYEYDSYQIRIQSGYNCFIDE